MATPNPLSYLLPLGLAAAVVGYVYTKRMSPEEAARLSQSTGTGPPLVPEFVSVGFGKSFDIEPLYRAGRMLEAKATIFLDPEIKTLVAKTPLSDPEILAMLDLASLLKNLGSTSPLVESLRSLARRLRDLPGEASRTPANLGIDLAPLRDLGAELLDRAKTNADSIIDARIMYDLGRLLQHAGDTSPLIAPLLQRGRDRGLA